MWPQPLVVQGDLIRVDPDVRLRRARRFGLLFAPLALLAAIVWLKRTDEVNDWVATFFGLLNTVLITTLFLRPRPHAVIDLAARTVNAVPLGDFSGLSLSSGFIGRLGATPITTWRRKRWTLKLVGRHDRQLLLANDFQEDRLLRVATELSSRLRLPLADTR